MIKSLKVAKLNQRMDFDIDFHEDINIITGKNGSGKTTVLKLLWYAISGNLERILTEIDFQSFELETDTLMVGIIKKLPSTNRKRPDLFISSRIGDSTEVGFTRTENRIQSGSTELASLNRKVSRSAGSSVFFPTFRRIEGGYSINSKSDYQLNGLDFLGSSDESRSMIRSSEGMDLQRAVRQLSERMSSENHRFVASISTDDIVRLLTDKYAEISERTNQLHQELSNLILKQVKTNGQGLDKETQADQKLGEIIEKAERVTWESNLLMKPISALSDLIERIFQYKGIKLGEPITLGQAREAIASEVLSAGEKQMLSFLCYNAFANKACIFIDEPEISLHVDWQRSLFPILLKQSTGNQFIVATHSPFIYSKYSDKEIVLDEDRGDADADAPHDGGRDRKLPETDDSPDALSGRLD